MRTTGQTDGREDAVPRRDSLSTSLLVDLTTITVDPAYVEAAARRAATGRDPVAPKDGGALFIVALAVLGMLVAIAARQTRLRAPELARTRSHLVQRIDDMSRQADADTRQLAGLRRDLARQRDLSLATTDTGRRLAEQLRSLEHAVGTVAVEGPGVVVRLGDQTPPGEPRDALDDGRVQDRDIQDVVNALWAAGAEAVAVNGQRIGPLTAIRQAGAAILVDYRPLTSPYDIQAIGDPDTLQPAFDASPAISLLRTVADEQHLEFSVRRAKQLELPAASSSAVTVAKTAAGAPATSSAPERRAS